MSTLSTSVRFLRKAAALLLLPWLAWSCQVVADGDYEDEIETGATPNYINITISVSANNNPVTRANPTGGEYGDGTEKGIENRENEVSNITLIFYQDNTGINTISDDAKVVCVKRYAVRRFVEGEKPTNHTHKTSEPEGYADKEVLYTTGNQKLDETQLVIGQSYKVLVVANAFISATAGDKIKDIRDQFINKVYDGTGVGIYATNFVMTSETDATVTLTNPEDESANGENKKVYYFDCIHIERLAARIDFWAKTKDPDTTNPSKATYDATTYDHAGYVYNVGKKDGDNLQDHFVLTSITPFNIMNGNEYYFKRTNDATNPYLADEVATGDNANWVLDPYTASKTSTAHPDYLVSKLDDLRTLLAADDNHLAPAYEVKPSTQQTVTDAIFTVTGSGVDADNIIIGYPMENTLKGGETPLYYYATGLAFEGYYYKKNAPTDATSGKVTGGTRKVFYHYLRHQGEQGDAYQALTNETLTNETLTNEPLLCPASPAMNFGIVRNNIYRVNIESISSDNDNLFVKILIKVKKWDKFVHTPIYM